MPDFLSLGISNTYVHPLNEMNIKEPTLIQEKTIPVILRGKDIIAQAQTGTGKTFAFILPILEKLNPDADHIQALIVTPTRELAIQITNEIKKLIESQDDINVLAIYGGRDVETQLKKLQKNVQIVIATPGRLIDHLQRQTIDLQSLSFLVLDEADLMLFTGFQNEVETIIRNTAETRQTLLFSATISEDVQKLAQKYLRNPESILIEKKQGPSDHVVQKAICLSNRAKQSVLVEMIENDRPYLAVVFCRTKRRVSKLYGELKSLGYACDELHSDISQAKRERVMKQFRTAKLQVLVATDVASRGLDVEGITNVYNYDIPEDAESYVHRIGRTGRAGMDGMAMTFYTRDDANLLKEIEAELMITLDKEEHESANAVENTMENENDQPNRKKHYSKKKYKR